MYMLMGMSNGQEETDARKWIILGILSPQGKRDPGQKSREFALDFCNERGQDMEMNASCFVCFGVCVWLSYVRQGQSWLLGASAAGTSLPQ